MARSRAGVLLALLALVGSFALARGGGAWTSTLRSRLLIGGAVVAAILVTAQFALVRILERLETEVGADLRWEMARTTMQAIGAFMPFGSGIGTFPPVYAMFEPIASIREVFVNHAHNDYLELVLEGGLPALAILALFLIWFVIASVRAWRRGGISAEPLAALLAKAASISVLLILLHSTVDYPLRMTAIAALFAFFCAVLVPPPPVSVERPEIVDRSRLRRRIRVMQEPADVPAVDTVREI
jgi:O-antigen ligase